MSGGLRGCGTLLVRSPRASRKTSTPLESGTAQVHLRSSRGGILKPRVACMSGIPVLGRWRPEICELETDTGYIVSLSVRPGFLTPQQTATPNHHHHHHKKSISLEVGACCLTPTCNLRIWEANTRPLKFQASLDCQGPRMSQALPCYLSFLKLGQGSVFFP